MAVKLKLEQVHVKEINTTQVPGKYTVPAIKSVLILLQNVPEKILGCIGLFWLYQLVSNIYIYIYIFKKNIQKHFI